MPRKSSGLPRKAVVMARIDDVRAAKLRAVIEHQTAQIRQINPAAAPVSKEAVVTQALDLLFDRYADALVSSNNGQDQRMS